MKLLHTEFLNQTLELGQLKQQRKQHVPCRGLLGFTTHVVFFGEYEIVADRFKDDPCIGRPTCCPSDSARDVTVETLRRDRETSV